jgi:deazaflavin-dependent oxidoreductase (nitroreductase family)
MYSNPRWPRRHDGRNSIFFGVSGTRSRAMRGAKIPRRFRNTPPPRAQLAHRRRGDPKTARAHRVPRGYKVGPMTARYNRMLRRLLAAPIRLYHWRLGWLLGRRFLLLRHVGRRTGLRRETVLEVMEYRRVGPELVVMSAFGPGAGWLRNLAAHPHPEVVVGRRRFVAAYRLLGAEEAIGVVAGYERHNRFATPIIRLVLSRFLGWRYRSSERDRRRLVAQLPLIAFRPQPDDARLGDLSGGA